MSFRRGRNITTTSGLCLVLFAGAGLKPVQARGHDVWRIIENHHFQALSDADVADVKKLLLDLERFRLIVLKLTTVKVPSDAPPVEVILFGNANEFIQNIHTHRVAGFAAHDKAGRLFIVMPVSLWGADAMHDIRHEYVHTLMAYHVFQLPQWYNEGLAEFLASVRIRSDEIILGKPPKERTKYWDFESLYSYDKLVADDIDTKKVSFADAYMQYWLLTDYLLTDAKRAKNLGKYIALYNSGMDSLKAFKISFGMTPSELYRRRLRSYVRFVKVYGMKFDFSGMDTDFRTRPAPRQDMKDMHNLLAHVDLSK